MFRIVRTFSNLHEIFMHRCGDVIRIAISGTGSRRWNRLVKVRNLCNDLPDVSISQKMLFQHMAQQCLLRKRRIFTAYSKAFTRSPQLRMVRCAGNRNNRQV